MVWETTQTRMVFGYNNRVRPDYCASVAVFDLVTTMPTVLGAGPDNMRYEDPWLPLQAVNTPAYTSPRRIEFTFASAQSFTCLGFVNHNLLSVGYTYVALWYWVPGSPGSFVQAGGGNYNLGTTIGDPDFLLRFETHSSTIWRVEFSVTAGVQPAFSLGSVFLGTYYEVEMNPTDGGVFLTQTSEMTMADTLGGTRVVGARVGRLSTQAELSFPRVPFTQAKKLAEVIHRPNVGHMVAMIPPEAVGYGVPVGVPHLFGFITSMVYGPRGGASATSHRYDVTMNLEGCT